MSIPNEPCPICKSVDWYLHHGIAICNICNPCPDPKLIEETHRARMEAEMEAEKQTLIQRCQKGLAVLVTAKKQIDTLVPELDDPEFEAKNKIWSGEMDKWKETQNKLWGLVQTLMQKYNYRGCLFTESWTQEICNNREKETGQPCWACPRNWEEVLFPATDISQVVAQIKEKEKHAAGPNLFMGGKK